MNEPDPHPASCYAADPDGILLEYGPGAVVEHYYGEHLQTRTEWVARNGILLEETRELSKEEILKELTVHHAIIKSQQDAREGRAGLI